ncbi:MAG: hypothetical protein GY847_34685 [Proteobacteria bacterium]|nr:hypothetical protein [Pseudomonadota bacterium]
MLGFFGQFLVEKDIIKEEQLSSALELMKENNRTVFELAAEAGLFDGKDVDQINPTQRLNDFYFSETAIMKGLLTREQVNELLAKQRTINLRIGEAAIKLEYVTGDQVEKALNQYHNEQKEYQQDQELPNWITQNPMIKYILDQFPILVIGMAFLPLKLGNGNRWDKGQQFDIQVSIDLKSDKTLTVTLDVSEPQARGIAKGMFGLEEDEIDKEMMNDIVGELLNIVAGNAKSYVQTGSLAISLGLPQYDQSTTHGFSFDFATPDGHGLLIFSTSE